MSDDDLTIYETLLDKKQFDLVTAADSDYVIASDVYPPDRNTIKVIPMPEAFAQDYQQPDFLNSDIAIADPNGYYHKEGVRFTLVPLLIHSSFRGF
jgi:hypothetical protein